jgi:hypothetical protein
MMGHLQRIAAAAVFAFAACVGVGAQTQATTATASAAQFTVPNAPSQFPELPLRRDAGENTAGGWVLPLMAIIGIGVVGAALFWRARTNRRSVSNPKSRMLAVDALRLTQQMTVHVVHWQGEQFLIASSAQRATLLARKPLAEPPP